MIIDTRATAFGLIAPPLYNRLLQVALLREPVGISTQWGTLHVNTIGLLGLTDGSFIAGFLCSHSHHSVFSVGHYAITKGWAYSQGQTAILATRPRRAAALTIHHLRKDKVVGVHYLAASQFVYPSDLPSRLKDPAAISQP